ncbi:MAG: hypothetical protein ACFCD0_13140 [Gemmataceae bacterium]
MSLDQWFEGIYLLGQFNRLRTGCWLLVHGGEAAILEMPPRSVGEPSPAVVAQEAVAELSVSVKYLLCTHKHWDHFSRATFNDFRGAFPTARAWLQRGFSQGLGVSYFDDVHQLDLSGGPFFLVPAPKHSSTDTMVIFRGVVCTGDWELGTISSVHDWTWFWGVPREQKLKSIERMERFPQEYNYHIHSTFSVHANDKRVGIDFPGLMASTRVNKPK